VLALGGSAAVATLGGGGVLVAQRRPIRRPDNDPVRDHIFGQAVKLAKDLQASPRRPETFAALAANARLHAAHAKATGLDAALAAALGREVDRRGRDAIIDAAAGPEMEAKHHQLLDSLGLGELHVAMQDRLPRSAYEQGLNTLLVGGGITRNLENFAAQLEQMHANLAKLATPQGARVQLGCESFRATCEILKEAAAVICAISAVQPEFAPLCPILAAEAATACFIAWLGGC
jgi:hypothetical protein